ncbi:MAG: hypothetical protein ACRCTI_04120 [Beijerinckiaceae bacterium]
MGTHIQIGTRTLDFLRFPNRPAKLRVVRVDNVLVGVDEKGRLYSTQWLGNVAYLGESSRLEASLVCCERLGLLTADEVSERRERVRAASVARDRNWAAKDLKKSLKTLGLKPTKAQEQAITDAIAVAP